MSLTNLVKHGKAAKRTGGKLREYFPWCAASGLAVGGMLAYVPLRAAGVAFDLISDYGKEQTDEFLFGALEFFYGVSPWRSETAVGRVIKDETLSPLEMAIDTGADVALTAAAVGITYLVGNVYNLYKKEHAGVTRRKAKKEKAGVGALKNAAARALVSSGVYALLTSAAELVALYSALPDDVRQKVVEQQDTVANIVASDVADKKEYLLFAALAGAGLAWVPSLVGRGVRAMWQHTSLLGKWLSVPAVLGGLTVGYADSIGVEPFGNYEYLDNIFASFPAAMQVAHGTGSGFSSYKRSRTHTKRDKLRKHPLKFSQGDALASAVGKGIKQATLTGLQTAVGYGLGYGAGQIQKLYHVGSFATLS